MKSRTGFRWAGVAAVLVVLFVGLPGCAKTREPGRYYSDKGFSIRFPDGWELKEGFMGGVVTSMSPLEGPEDKFRENVNVTLESLPSAIALKDYCTAGLANMQKLMTDFEQIEQGDATLDGQASKWMVYTFRMGEVNIKGLIYFTVRGKRAYVITCTASPETFDQFRPQFEEIVKTWRFE